VLLAEQNFRLVPQAGSSVPIALRSAAVTENIEYGVEPVYNMMVDGSPEFLANGILTHNCRLHMFGTFPELEDQSSSWVPGETKKSPDRTDALVWACLSLATRQKGLSFALGRHLRARSSRGRLPALSAASLAMKKSGGGPRR
jgi:hypothetical protein